MITAICLFILSVTGVVYGVCGLVMSGKDTKKVDNEDEKLCTEVEETTKQKSKNKTDKKNVNYKGTKPEPKDLESNQLKRSKTGEEDVIYKKTTKLKPNSGLEQSKSSKTDKKYVDYKKTEPKPKDLESKQLKSSKTDKEGSTKRVSFAEYILKSIIKGISHSK